MTTTVRIITAFVIPILVLVNSIGCTPSISQEELDRVRNELINSKNQLAGQQDKLAAADVLNAQYQELKIKYQELSTNNGTDDTEIRLLRIEKEELTNQLNASDGKAQARYDDLKKKYDELKIQFNALTTPAVLNEAGVERTIFAHINEDRRNNGLSELVWSDSIYSWAHDNSVQMANQHKELYQGGVLWQLNFWASGYETMDTMANGALKIWATDNYSYSQRILNSQIKYGVVSAYKSGNIYYISYLGSSTP